MSRNPDLTFFIHTLANAVSEWDANEEVPNVTFTESEC